MSSEEASSITITSTSTPSWLNALLTACINIDERLRVGSTTLTRA